MQFDFDFDLNSFFSNYVAIGMTLSIVLVIILGLIWFNFKDKITEGFVKDSSSSSSTSSSSSSKEVEILFFYTDWCPHCKTAKPEWEGVKQDKDGTVKNGYTLRFKDINCSQESADIDTMMKTYNVEGYPTIKVVKDSDVIDYDAKPSRDTITEVLNTVI